MEPTSNHGNQVEIRQESIQYVLMEEGESGDHVLPRDTQDLLTHQIQHVGVTQELVLPPEGLSGQYTYVTTPQPIDEMSMISQQQAVSQPGETFVSQTGETFVSETSGETFVSETPGETFVSETSGGLHAAESQAESQPMSYIVEIPANVHMTDAQLENVPIVQLVNESLTSEILNSLPPGSRVIFDNKEQYPQLLAALAAPQKIVEIQENLPEHETEMVSGEPMASDDMASDDMASHASKLTVNEETAELRISTVHEMSHYKPNDSPECQGQRHDTPESQGHDMPDCQGQGNRPTVSLTDHTRQLELEEAGCLSEKTIAQSWKSVKKDTCKVFDQVVATVSKVLLDQLAAKLYPDVTMEKSALLEHILVSKRQVTDLMVRENHDDFLLAGDLIDIMEIHNVLLGNLRDEVSCRHKPMNASAPLTKDQAVMCSDATEPPISSHKRTKRPHYQYVEITPDEEEKPAVPVEDTNKRHSRRVRRAPARMVDEDYLPSKRQQRNRCEIPTNVTHVVITPLDDHCELTGKSNPANDPGESSLRIPCLMGGEMKAEDGDRENGVPLVDPDISGITLLQTVLKPEESDPFSSSLMPGVSDTFHDVSGAFGDDRLAGDDEVSRLLPIIMEAAENSERQDNGGYTLAEKQQAERIAKENRLIFEKKAANSRKKKDYENNTPFRYYCKECSFKSKRESHFKKHVLLHSEKQLPVLRCTKCDYSSLHMSHLRHHEVQHNTNALQCQFCTYRTTTMVQLKKHHRYRHQVSKSRTKELKEHRCTHCYYKTNRQHLLQRHMLCHTHVNGNKSGMHGMLIKSYQCTHCEYTSGKKDQFIRHMENVHSDNRPHLCDLCGMGFKRTDTLKTHRLTHLDKSLRTYKFFCPHCNKGVRSKAHLEEHLAMHTSKREYLCHVCGAAFKTRGIQRRHVATIHVNPKGFLCTTCNKAFNTRYALQRHQRIHVISQLQQNQAQVMEPISMYKDVPEGDTITINISDPLTMTNQTEVIHIQPLLQEQGLEHGQVITELQVLPLGSSLEQVVESAETGHVTGVLEDGFVQHHDGMEVQLQPTLVQNGSGGTTFLYLTNVHQEIS